MENIERVLLEILNPNHPSEYDPEFWWYFRQCCDNQQPAARLSDVRKLINEIVLDLKLARFTPVGKVILDAGCGYGIAALILSCMGAREVHGMDLSESMISTFKKILSTFPEIKHVYPIIGNVSQSGYPEESFDFILCNEALSHYYDYTGFLREARRILKPGGILFISDANNGANPYLAWRTRRLWERFEIGPPGRVFFSTVSETYQDKRARIIQQIMNDLAPETVNFLARLTSGYTREQLIQACQNYLHYGVVPNSIYRFGVTPVDPDSGNYQERLIHPFGLVRQLTQNGFRARVYTYFGGAGGNKTILLINQIIQNTSPWSLPIGRAIKVVAVKKKLMQRTNGHYGAANS